MTQEKITRKMLDQQPVVFRPATTEEAVRVQQVLFDLGCYWVSTGIGIWEPETCMRKGIRVKNGVMRSSTKYEDEVELACRLLIGDSDPVSRMTDRELMTHYFKQLTERQNHLEEKLDRILAHIQPNAIKKDTLKP